MQSFDHQSATPDIGPFTAFDHCTFYVGNALQAASFYCTRFGFNRYAYAGLETGNRDTVTHVVKQNNILFAFKSPLNPGKHEIADHLVIHGDGVKDIAFSVDDTRAVFEKAKQRGAKVVMEPYELKDEHGVVVLATVATYGDTTHTFVERRNFTGHFLPGFKIINEQDPINKVVGSPNLELIDHIVGNQPDLKMESAVQYYEQVFGFHRFWSVDDSIMHTEYSALRSIVVANYEENIKMPINEPAQGKRKSQIQEYVDYYAGAGVQHIALKTSNILDSVQNLHNRGLPFLIVPKTYYTTLREKLAKSSLKIEEDLDRIEELSILVDYDDKGYLLQIFTKCLEDRPTLFIEIIQRHNNNGFGAGNFKSLFEAIERDQAERGNL